MCYKCQYDTINTVVYVDKPSLPLADETSITCTDTHLKAANGFAGYKWSNGANDQEITVSPPGVFTVSLTNACGTYPKKYILNKPTTALYNVITPNGDGNNDDIVFNKTNIPVSLHIYNRWGAEVYHNADYHNDWNGSNLETGIYYYRVTYEGCENNQSWIEIIR